MNARITIIVPANHFTMYRSPKQARVLYSHRETKQFFFINLGVVTCLVRRAQGQEVRLNAHVVGLVESESARERRAYRFETAARAPPAPLRTFRSRNSTILVFRICTT